MLLSSTFSALYSCSSTSCVPVLVLHCASFLACLLFLRFSPLLLLLDSFSASVFAFFFFFFLSVLFCNIHSNTPALNNPVTALVLVPHFKFTHNRWSEFMMKERNGNYHVVYILFTYFFLFQLFGQFSFQTQCS